MVASPTRTSLPVQSGRAIDLGHRGDVLPCSPDPFGCAYGLKRRHLHPDLASSPSGAEAVRISSMDDPFVILAAVAGGLTGLILLVRVSRGSSDDRADEPLPRPVIAFAKTERPRPSAVPVLTAVGVAAVGVGLVVGTGEGGLGPVALVPGTALLLAAIVLTARRFTAGGSGENGR